MVFALLARPKRTAAVAPTPAPKRKAPSGQGAIDSPPGLHRSVSLLHVASLPIAPVIQAKLRVGEPNDKFEQEADRVADEVMRMRARDPVNQSSLPIPSIGQRIQRLCPECEEEEEETLQAKEKTGHIPPEVSSNLESHLQSVKCGGQPLPASVRAFFEPRFGCDFSEVRLHSDSKTAQTASLVNARAFTIGQNIGFAAGEYRPSSKEGIRLLAHELVHAIQQGATGAPRSNDLLGQGGARIKCRRTPEVYIARQCDPAWAELTWNQRVLNAIGMARNTAQARRRRDHCFIELIQEAMIGRPIRRPSAVGRTRGFFADVWEQTGKALIEAGMGGVAVHRGTNAADTVAAAIAAGHYLPYDPARPQVNFDSGLNSKNDVPVGASGITLCVGPPLNIYIILGPRAVNEVGPRFTQMVVEHEEEHAFRCLGGDVAGGGRASPEEELAITTEDFVLHFLDLWTVNLPCDVGYVTFAALFDYYEQAGQAARDSAFSHLENFYMGQRNDACVFWKFQRWFHEYVQVAHRGNALETRMRVWRGFGIVPAACSNRDPSPCPQQ